MALNICCVTSYLANVSPDLRISSFSRVKNHLVRVQNLGVSITLPRCYTPKCASKLGDGIPAIVLVVVNPSLTKHLVHSAWKDDTIFAELLPLMKSWSDTSEAETTSRFKTRKNLRGWLICASSWHCQGLSTLTFWQKLLRQRIKTTCESRLYRLLSQLADHRRQNTVKWICLPYFSFLSESFGFSMHLPERLLQQMCRYKGAAPLLWTKMDSYHQQNLRGDSIRMHPIPICAERFFLKTH